MLFKSRERQIHEHIRQEIETRLARAGAPGEIGQFLLERWSYLLLGVYLSHGDRHPDWEAGWHTVNALLWSLTPKRDQGETEQFLRLLPTLLGRLQDGCDAMNMAPAERDELFSQLALMHAAVARAGLQSGGGEAAPMTRLQGDADREFSEAELAALATEPVAEAASVMPGRHGADLDGLAVGAGVRFRIEGADKVLYLQWLSPMGGMYLFSDREGFDAVSLTRARLSEKLARGEADLL